jgi:Flagellar hook capping protein
LDGHFRPGPLPDGEYQLEVESFDPNGNPSGDQRYIITFKVINERTVTRVFNYPNPFSTDTRFVYTLTGDQEPEIFQIHVYTVSGRLIKVIDLKELGEAVVGNHITNYAWDGTDDYGDRLATGVYLYRVLLKMPGESTVRQVDTDGTEQYFSRGFGKMVIMR